MFQVLTISLVMTSAPTALVFAKMIFPFSVVRFLTWHSYLGFSIVAAVLADVVADVGLCFDGDVADGVGGRCGHISVSISAMH